MFDTLARVMTASSDTLKLRCRLCGHRAEWTRDRAMATFGVHASPFTVRHRLVCEACGARGRSEVWI